MPLFFYILQLMLFDFNHRPARSYILPVIQTASISIRPPIKPDWKRISKSWGHPFHPMCSYMAMFPPRIPHYFIQRFTRPGDRVLDPFSGRGTTPTQACVEGRIGIANDLNPLAYVLSHAKVDPPAKQTVLARLRELEKGCRRGATAIPGRSDPITVVFHPDTLQQLAYLRTALTESREDIFIRATILGILHGKYRRSGTDSIYLSIDMPNTFSMSPDYIRKYVQDKGLQYLPLDVFTNTRRRLERLYRRGRPPVRGLAYQQDVRHLHEVIPSGSIQLVMSSPPYLKVIKYGLYNWIRLWFLDVPVTEVDHNLDDGHALPAYLEFMGDTIRQLERLMQSGGVAALVIGDVAKKGEPPINLAAAVWEAVAKQTGLRLVDIVPDAIADSAKVTKIWNETRGQATAVDRILVLCKGDGPATNHPTVDW
ncbi:MAG: site-specific DNA-methyltransferase [Fidelibacterota bacterium]|nr:MAG: site-specific DNA-methyltransferase [Candidatus Neomarinimicrobiota bacterium]